MAREERFKAEQCGITTMQSRGRCSPLPFDPHRPDTAERHRTYALKALPHIDGLIPDWPSP